MCQHFPQMALLYHVTAVVLMLIALLSTSETPFAWQHMMSMIVKKVDHFRNFYDLAVAKPTATELYKKGTPQSLAQGGLQT